MKNQKLFAWMCILFNHLGVPNFMQGHLNVGITKNVLNIVTCGVAAIINFICGVKLGLKVLKMSEEEYKDRIGYLSAGFPSNDR